MKLLLSLIEPENLASRGGAESAENSKPETGGTTKDTKGHQEKSHSGGKPFTLILI